MQQPAEKQQQTNTALFCKFCGNQMPLTRLEPSLLPGHDHIIYECSRCGHNLTKDVPYR